MVALSRNIGRKAAFEMLTTGRFIDCDEAQALGLINRAVTPEDLEAETMDLAQTIASKLGAAVKIGIQAFYDQAPLPTAEAYAHTARVMVTNMLNPDTDEGITAFLEKRAPNWDQ
jgi:enoyl-CoA hydratase/carnithine racemase